ncbi:NfeD family protein [Halobacterium bonnevillei]|uniref:NfeD family protein n=1 Tax=Halobacterium bonnevillei TaxID=2692200 RepID=A0A6B0SHV4_9EURY|nr:NfeD family protein [Halobacterium bonnevillei]MXR21248.1 NfeD family protein [Halobacterium bonnevillei]
MVELFGQSLSFLLVLVGTALCIMEALAPGAHLIVLGVALLAAGLIGLFVPAAATPFILAILVLGIGLSALYLYRNYDIYQGTGRGQTRDAEDLRGERGYVVETVTPRSGRVKLESGGFDPSYGARSISGTIDEGADIVVVDPGGGNILTVEAVNGQDDIDRELDRDPTDADSA